MDAHTAFDLAQGRGDQPTKPFWTERPGLFWARTGAVACGRHTPYPGSDTWVMEGWSRITPRIHEAILAEGAVNLTRCESCGRTYEETQS
jgi:hypothetical protein